MFRFLLMYRELIPRLVILFRATFIYKDFPFSFLFSSSFFFYTSFALSPFFYISSNVLWNVLGTQLLQAWLWIAFPA